MELFTKLGLKEVASLVGTLGKSVDELYLQDTVEVDGKLYFYEKKGNEITITDKKDHKMSVRIDYSEMQAKDDRNRDVAYLHHEVEANYGLPNGDRINLFNNVSLKRGYGAFENVQRHDLMRGLRVKYVDKEGEVVASTSINLNRICLKENNTIYDFSDKGITVGNRTITLDGETLVSISGMEAPKLQEVKEFDLVKEQRKIDKFMHFSPDLHPFTVEALEDTKRKLERKNRYAKDIIDYYDQDMEKVREAIAVREKITKGIDQEVIDPKAIEAVDRSLRKKLIERQEQSGTGFGRR